LETLVLILFLVASPLMVGVVVGNSNVGTMEAMVVLAAAEEVVMAHQMEPEAPLLLDRVLLAAMVLV
jgi:hypothetical protein